MALPVTEEPVDETLVEITLDPSQNESTQNGVNGDEVTADEITLSQSIIGPSPDKKKRKKWADVDPDEWRAPNFSNEEVFVIVEEAIAKWDVIHANVSETDQVTNRKKIRCWQDIAQKVNAWV